jgi:TPP-dependent pyruvate/acetoin dehydrogenase alpha subunit
MATRPIILGSAADAGAADEALLCETERLGGHYIGDAQVYRDKDELRRLRATRDPIQNLRERLKLSDAEWRYERRMRGGRNRCGRRLL